MKYIIKEVKIVNRGQIYEGDILLKNGRIERVDSNILSPNAKEIPGMGQYALPGIIDDQVHFRDPGLTHKADLYTEPRAAVVGGVTSFMEMPNTKPTTTNQMELAAKYQRASEVSIGNFSFFMGATNDNLDEVLKTDPRSVCGIKAFMGSSTGNMLVDDPVTLSRLFDRTPMLIATHCEDEMTIKANMEAYKKVYNDRIPMKYHPRIRNAAGCLISSSLAVELAKKYNARLHILHLSTDDELGLFDNTIPLSKKRITAEVCVHHLHFDEGDYEKLGSKIKCNPAIKGNADRVALWEALLDDRLDIIATDHAPHTALEKSNTYLAAPSGIPLVQHSLNIMLDYYHKGKISLERIVEKMCHAPAQCFQVKDRGFLDEGYWADVVLVDVNKRWRVTQKSILYKCGWSPLLDRYFKGKVMSTFVSGHLAYHNGKIDDSIKGKRIFFDR